jgi:hypothetical protein
MWQRIGAFLLTSCAAACGNGANDDDPMPMGGSGGASGGTSGSGGKAEAGSGGKAEAGSGGKAEAGSGGKAGAGGSAGNTSGGSGGTTATAVRGAASVHIVAGAGCSLEEQYQDFPMLASGHPVTATDRTQAVTNGETAPDGHPATVLCSWLGTSIDVVITLGPAGDERDLFLRSPTAEGVMGTGSVGVTGPDFPEQYANRSSPCSFTPIEVDEASRSVWGEFACTSFATEDESDSCAVDTSYYFFENCTLP